MRNLIVLALATILVAGCTNGYSALKNAGAKVQKCVSLTASPGESEKQESVSIGARKEQVQEDTDTPSPKFIWDSKMIFW